MSSQPSMQTFQEIQAKYPDVDINTSGGTDSYQDGVVVVERYNVALIVKHPTDNSFLISQWKKSNWNGFLTGGVEQGDTLEETARKEIEEESGFKHIAHIQPMDFTSHGLFFHVIKGVNRLAHYHLVFVQLADLERDEISEEEKAIADLVWVPSEQVGDILTRPDMKLLWNYYLKNISI